MLLHESCRELVVKVETLAPDAGVLGRDPLARPESVLGALLLMGQSPLKLLQALFGLPQKAWVLDLLAVRGRYKREQAEVDADGLLHKFSGHLDVVQRDYVLQDEGGEPFAVGLSHDCARLQLRVLRKRSVENDPHVPNLREEEPLPDNIRLH